MQVGGSNSTNAAVIDILNSPEVKFTPTVAGADPKNNRQQSQEPDKDAAAKQDSHWEGKCIHIVVELAECGDVQNVSNLRGSHTRLNPSYTHTEM